MAVIEQRLSKIEDRLALLIEKLDKRGVIKEDVPVADRSKRTRSYH